MFNINNKIYDKKTHDSDGAVGDETVFRREMIEQLEPKELMKRVSRLEETLYSNKEVFNTEEACAYLGISESLLYKMTANREIPHYKPRGKNLFFSKRSWMRGCCDTMSLRSMKS